MAKRIQRKGYIQFRDGTKLDIYAAYHKSASVYELVTCDGISVYSENREVYPLEYESRLCSRIRVPMYHHHMYKVVINDYDDGWGLDARLHEVAFDHFTLFKPN